VCLEGDYRRLGVREALLRRITDFFPARRAALGVGDFFLAARREVPFAVTRPVVRERGEAFRLGAFAATMS